MQQTLRAWRLAKEITIEQMADMLDIHPNTYRNWEKEPGTIPISKAYIIADSLQVELGDIIFE